MTGGSGACWSGARIIGEWGDSRSWTGYHGTAGFSCIGAPGLTVENLESSGYGDALKTKAGCDRTTFRHVYVDHAYDDCYENDYHVEARIEDSLLECYVGISTRASSGQATTAGGLVTLDRVRMKLEPQSNVYKGTSPGHGGFFKYADSTGVPDPAVNVVDSIFYAVQKPNHQDLGPPEAGACSGNVILWGGSGSFPGKASWLARCPDTLFVESPSQSAALWAATVTAWGAP